MDRAFRLTLRIAVALMVLLGLGLVVYSLRTGVRRSPVVTATQRSDPGAEGSGPGQEGSAEPEQPGSASGSSGDESGEMEHVLLEFSQVIRSPEEQESQAVLSGPRAVYNPGSEMWRIVEPLLVAHLADKEPGEGLDVRLGQVEITAEEAALYENRGVAELSGKVSARGKDFQITTDRVTYHAADRSMRSEASVEIRKDRIDSAGVRRPVLLVNGKGLNVDMSLRKMTIMSDVRTRLYDVSEDFLAGQGVADEGAPQTGQVVITCGGKAVYEHLARKVSFFENVRASFGMKRLRCEQLTIQFEENQETGELDVTDIVAAGSVQLHHLDQVLQGDSLDWRNVTQTGLLKGTPARVQTPGFDIAVDELSFYRLNSRFHAEGAGQLEWKGSEETEQDDADADQWGAGPFRMSAGEPVTIIWQDSMTFDMSESRAVFQGRTTVEQAENSLSCDRLDVGFAENNRELHTIEARGQVGMRDRLTGVVREVLCEHLLWDARQGVIELTAAEGKTVTISSGARTIVAPRMAFHNSEQVLRCPEGGKLTVEPETNEAPEDAAGAIAVEWQGLMEFRQGTRTVAQFQGGATVRRAREMISGEQLMAEFDEDMRLARLTATGGAVVEAHSAPRGAGETGGEAPLPDIAGVEGERWRLECESVTLAPLQGMIRSGTPGSLTVLEADEPSGTVTWSRNMSLDSSEGYALFEGDVQANVPGAKLNSDELRLDFEQTGQLHHAQAQGHVLFVSKGKDGWQMTSRSAQAVFAAGNVLRQFIARGEVEIVDKSRALYAERVQLFLEQVEGREQPVIERAVAERDVWVWYDQEERLEAGGDRLEWLRETDTYVLTGDPHAYVRQGNIRTQNWKVMLKRSSGEMELPPGDRPVTITVESEGQ